MTRRVWGKEGMRQGGCAAGQGRVRSGHHRITELLHQLFKYDENRNLIPLT